MAIRKEEKSLEQAQKEAEMIGEFAKDGRNRKEAKTIANKLEAAIEQHNEEKQADRNSANLTSASHREERVIEKISEMQLEKPQEIFLNIHKDLVTYKNKQFKLQEKLQITT
jgi:hypothetical protein